MAILKIPDGNAFKLRITAMVNSAAADLSVVTNIIVNFVRRGRLSQTYGIDANGKLVIENDGSLARGIYGVEITGYHDGKPWRHYIKNAFKIVDEAEDADEPTIVDDLPVYDLSENMTFGGDGVTASYVDNAIDAHNTDETAHSDLRQAIADAGQVDDVQVNGNTVVNGNKIAEITVPTKVSELDNDSDFATKAEAQAMADAEGVTEVNVTIDDQVGTPSVERTFENGVLGLAFRNIKGEQGEQGIQGIQGEKGDPGDSAVFDPETGNILATLHNTTGDDDANGMTQKAVTDAIKDFVPISDSSDQDADLEITDDFDNVLARFADGHFETKNFNSEETLESIRCQEQNLGTENYAIFSSEASYNIGDIVRYNGLLYKFINMHSGEWDSADVEPTNIVEELDKYIGSDSSDADTDLDITDEDGYVLVRFADGHLRTLNFDSKAVASNIAGKRISILGDSISTFSGWMPANGVNGYAYESYATYYPHSPLNSVAQTWWSKVINELSLVLGQNCSWSGSCTAGDGEAEDTAHDGCSDRRIADLAINGTPDIIVIFMGTNDFSTTGGRNIPVGDLTSKDHFPTNGVKSTFSEGYGLMLSKVLQTYPLAHVFCCSLLDNSSSVRDQDGVYPTQNPHGVYLEDYNAKIKELALGYGAHFIDLHNCGIHWNNISLLTVDGQTHPNDAGHTLIANVIKRELVKYF